LLTFKGKTEDLNYRIKNLLFSHIPRRWLVLVVLVGWGLCMSAKPLFAQQDASQLRFEHITVNDGLSHSDAMAVVQDQQGFIWVGTNNGLDRYDGYQMKSYLLPIDNTNGVSNNRVRALYVGAEGTLWVGTEGGGVSRYLAGQDRFVRLSPEGLSSPEQQTFQLLTESEITTITSASPDVLWVGTRQSGLFRLHVGADSGIQSIAQVHLESASRDRCEITDLATDQAGNHWVATLDQGLYRIPASESKPLARLAHRLSTYQVLALSLNRKGDLWIGASNTVLWVSKQELGRDQIGKFHAVPHSFRGIGCLYQDSFDRLWVGTNFGLSVVPLKTSDSPPSIAGKVTTFLPMDDEPTGINSGRVHAILEDRFQVLWLAVSAGGINKVDLRQKPFGHLRRQPNQLPALSNNYINGIYKEEKRGLLWIATRNGFSRYDLSRKTYKNYLSNNLPGNVTGIDVSCIYQDSDSTLWFGTRYDGLVALRRRGGQEVLTRYPQAAGPFRHLESITEDRFGTLWMASFYDGLIRMDRQGKVLATYGPGNSALPTGRFTFLLYDKSTDVLWASTQDAGVLKLRILPDGLQLLNQFAHDPGNPNSLRVNYAWPLLKDRRGTLWVGTIGGGLHQIVADKNGNETIRPCTDWLPDSDVESILEDRQGYIWCGGSGLLKINPVTRQVIRYDVVDGVQSNSFKIGAALRADSGELYFGGVNGITYFQPRQIQPNPYPPLVRLTGLALANRPVAVGESINGRVLIRESLDKPQVIEIRSGENDFSISFVGLNFANPRKHHYTYRLLGYNDRWIEPAYGQRTASFANLPAGDYTFMVKADNGEGRWSAQPATLQIRILPPWWKTWWAYALYTLLIGVALWVARRILLHQQALKNKAAFEHFQYEKEKELTDLKLRFFTNVSHELRTPLTLILGPMEELVATATRFPDLKEKMMLVHQQTRRLLSLTNQLLDFRRVESAAVPLRAAPQEALAFLTELFLMFRLKADEQGIQFAMEAPEEPIPLYFDRSKLEVVVINLLSNALKFTPADRRVTLRLEVVGDAQQDARYTDGILSDNYLDLQVCDEGKGIWPEELDRIFDVYYQASQADTMRVTGSGIGLSLVKQFVERHGGTIGVQSTIDRGTTFTVHFPFGSAHLSPADIVSEAEAASLVSVPEPAPDEVPEVPPPTAPASAPRILIVEDNDEVRQYLASLFTAGYEVHLAADGQEGWEQVQQLLPDLVISDVMMPRRDGLDLCRTIKQHPATLHIPVLLLTARVAAAHELEGLETGADDYVGKPFHSQLLVARANMLVGNREKLRQYYRQNLLLQPSEVAIPDADREFLEKAMQLVEANLTEPHFSAQWLFQEMGMSRSVFFRRIKGITGQSVIEFINDVRMKKAAQLLRTGSLRVAEVCELVGLEDPRYFRKAFQQLHGLTPSAYLKKHQLSPAEVGRG
jgi:signal transduction histidine kinase/ligand-binding sensor domain-containing protein/DNA-binding response OmpR family regulator